MPISALSTGRMQRSADVLLSTTYRLVRQYSRLVKSGMTGRFSRVCARVLLVSEPAEALL